MLALLLATALCLAASAQTTSQEWQVKAVQKYPQLGVQGSELNARFVAEYNKRVAANPAFLSDPKWPMLLADEVAALAPMPAFTPAPASSPHTTAPRKPAPPSLLDQWKSVSLPNQLLALFAGVILVLAVCTSVAQSIARRLRWNRLRTGADEYLAQLDDSNGIPTVTTQLALQPDERGFYCAASSLYESRTTIPTETRAGGFHLARDIWIGGSDRRSITGRGWEKLDTGTFTVTNQRVVFEGFSESVIIPIKRLESVAAMRDSVDLAISGRRKNMVFEAANPLLLASIIHLVIAGHDARLRAAYQRVHGATETGAANGNTTSTGHGYAQASAPPPHRPHQPPSVPEPEPEHILHARTLGLSGSFSFADVKRSYRDRIKEYHPDRVASLGPKLRELAETESKKINAAYAFFTRRFRA